MKSEHVPIATVATNMSLFTGEMQHFQSSLAYVNDYYFHMHVLLEFTYV